MKEILIDISAVHDMASGLGQYAHNLSQHIMASPMDDVDISMLGPAKYFETNPNPNAVNTSFAKKYLPFLNKDYDLWHATSQYLPYMPGSKSTYVLTIHDLNFLYELPLKQCRKIIKDIQQKVDRARAVVVVSDFTKSVVRSNLRLHGKLIRRIYNGVSLAPPEYAVTPTYRPGKKFLFAIGIINSKKNFHVLVRMMKHLPDYNLIIAGNTNDPYARQIKQMAEEEGLSARIHLPGKVTEGEKTWYYYNCEAIVYPSLYEGFGLPVIEGMLAGKMVFCPKTTSLPEVGGDQTVYWNNFQPEYMAGLVKEGIEEYNNNKEEKTKALLAHASKFTWEESVEKYKKLYKELIG